MAETLHNRTSRIIRPLHRPEVAERADYAGMYFSDFEESRGESRGIPHLAKNERDMGEPGICGWKQSDRLACGVLYCWLQAGWKDSHGLVDRPDLLADF